MGVPKNIAELAEKNQALLEKLGFTPGVDNPYELCTAEAYNQTGLFTAEMVAGIFGSQHKEPRQLTDPTPYIGMILVRPDMVHASSQFESYIQSRFDIEASEEVTLTAEAYWNIYKHDLYRTETMHSRLTRAALYIGSPARLISFSSSENSHQPVADYVKYTLRGSQGIYSPGTLRGDIVYRNAIQLGLHLLDDGIDQRIKLATDPFMAYRTLAREDSEDTANVTYPLLFYTGVGVHVPDSLEIGSDLPQLQALRLTTR